MSPAFRESLKILIPLIVVWLIFLCLLTWWAAMISMILFVGIVFTLFFFRDPERDLPGDDSVIVSAADGLVVAVDEFEEMEFGLGKVKRVAVFLSVFDVHVNRSPVAGTVKRIVHTPGAFLDVRHPDAALKNEHQDWLLETARGPVAVRQIAGLVARRIVAWSKEGDTLERGARFGMIRFGSRTEVYLPLSCEITVRVGDRVEGAGSPIAKWA
jgi:phosphatidylserine decarboxylase